MPVPLILRRVPVSRLDRAQRVRDPYVAVVYATADGQVEMLDDGRPVGLGDQVTGRFRQRYEVDVADHRHTVELRSSPPPARGGVYHFEALVSVGFRVVDPAQVVRRQIADGLQVVSDYLIAAFRDITADFPIEAAKEAEDTLNRRFQRGATIDGCIELYLCRARLRPEPAAIEYLRREQDARWDDVAKTAEHERDANDARRRNNLDLIQQSGGLERRAREREALAGRPFSMQDLLAMHLESNPGDTAGALQIAAEMAREQAQHQRDEDDRRWRKFQYMADRNMVNQLDLDQVRGAVLGQAPPSPAAVTAGPSSGDDGWEQPLHRPGDPAAPSVPGLIPVYLVVEDSPVMATGIEALNAGIQSLYDAVAAQPEIARVIRLSLLSYADQASIRLATQAVRLGHRLSAFTVEPGPVRLGAAFERLLDCIPRDAIELKRQTSSLRRPQVLLLAGGPPADPHDWTAAHRALTDRDRQRFAPDVIACGIGPAQARTVLEIATRPELAFVAPDDDLIGGIQQFCAFARTRVLEYGRAVLDGDADATFSGPDGFRPAAEITASTP